MWIAWGNGKGGRRVKLQFELSVELRVGLKNEIWTRVRWIVSQSGCSICMHQLYHAVNTEWMLSSLSIRAVSFLWSELTFECICECNYYILTRGKEPKPVAFATVLRPFIFFIVAFVTCEVRKEIECKSIDDKMWFDDSTCSHLWWLLNLSSFLRILFSPLFIKRIQIPPPTLSSHTPQHTQYKASITHTHI